MDVTVIGLAGCGKSTLLAALTGQDAGKAQIATVKVPDPRLDKLVEIYHPKKTTYAEIRAREAAWPGAGEGKRRSEMERYLDLIKGSSLFIHVVRACMTPAAADEPDVPRDLAKLDGEMIFADLFALERLLERERVQPMDATRKHAVLKAKELLESEQPLWSAELDEHDRAGLTGLNLVTLTPQLIVINLDENTPPDNAPLPAPTVLWGRQAIPVCLTVAAEVATLPPDEQDAFAAEMGLGEPAAHRIARAAFAQLNLISFFTVGDDDCHAWPVPAGTTAQKAAGSIHSDLERGFIRAEIVPYQTLVDLGSLKACRDTGKLQVEGKNYVLSDGEIMHVRFNV
ncbi:MAG TPA: DUF933 domain-containing protein [bacterium]|nr:DUF933 domain-containing protein [bacterium]